MNFSGFSNKFCVSARCKEINERLGIHEVCGMVAPFWWPISLNYAKIKILGIYIVPSGCLLTSIWECAELIVSKIKHLKQLFQEVFEIDDPVLRRELLRNCIQYHQEIIRMTYEWNKATKKSLAQYSWLSPVVICFITSQMLKTYSIGAFVHLMGFGVTVFFLCHAGQEIEDQCYNIQDALADSRWYKSDKKLLKTVQIIIMRCQKRIFLECNFPGGAYNYNLMIIIYKTAYSYVTVITNTGA
ncbi:uncharacterized protein LOC126739766 [Anthonomus grandis grandis]|uniref:uncharacterized protein LOC126739766 n=1 Tax=Anthonomus grandis grandis TaxID=2921223 RepID=UPI0021662077|nr:uncharacterized protein LOC126739766 [Anthonomus grandis grandis]